MIDRKSRWARLFGSRSGSETALLAQILRRETVGGALLSSVWPCWPGSGSPSRC